MPSRAYASFLQESEDDVDVDTNECQCPHGLMPHFYVESDFDEVNKFVVSMPSRAYASFLQYPFKNLGFMRFPEPVFAGICQNILTVTVFRAC